MKEEESEEEIKTEHGSLTWDELNENLDDVLRKRVLSLFDMFLSLKKGYDELNNERDSVEEKLVKMEGNAKEIEDLKQKLEGREKQISSMTGYPIATIDQLEKEPEKWGFVMKPHHYRTLKLLSENVNGLTNFELSAKLGRPVTTIWLWLRTLDVVLHYIDRKEGLREASPKGGAPPSLYIINQAGTQALKSYELKK